jgi:xanthine dehydrogenase YagR molybdenum-binding subunit
MSDETAIGKPLARVDGRLKVTGGARYAADQPAKNAAHAFLVTSRIGRGRIANIDVAEAERASGVVAIFTPKRGLKLYNVGNNFMEGSIAGENFLPLQNDKVLYYGQTIGLVIAETFEEARFAASLVRIKYEEQPVVASWAAAKAGIYQPAQVDFQPARISRTETGVADVKSAFDAADVKVNATYSTPIGHHTTIEPHATVAQWDGDHLTLYNCSQWMTGQQKTMAELLGLPIEQVRVVCPFIGGGFGSKATIWMHAALVAAAARQVGRPVRIALTREQAFTSNGHRPATIQTLQIGATKDGNIRALRHLTTSTSSEVHEFVEPAAHRTSLNFYQIPNVEVSHQLAPLNVGAPTWMRAPGEAPGMFALECAMDELAWALKMDPVELRLANYAETDLHKKTPFSSKHLRECYAAGAEKFGWASRHPDVRAARDGDWLVGVGMASSYYPGYRFPSTARVRVLADGTVLVSSATHDLGTGMYTIMCQVTADSLGVPVDRIRSELGDSSLPPAAIAGGSMSTASVMPAVKAAAEAVRKKIIGLAVKDVKSPLKGLVPEQVSVENGRLIAGEKAELLVNVIQRSGMAAVEATETSKPEADASKYSFYSYGAQFAEVRVHALTGEVRVSRFVSAMDVGRVLNPRTARSQVIGGVVWGIGMALTEESILDPKTARYITGDLGAYHVPVNADIPKIDVWFTDQPDMNFNSLGVRGVGEIGITGVAAALANAVYHATGQRIRELPITPDKILVSPKAREALV